MILRKGVSCRPWRTQIFLLDRMDGFYISYIDFQEEQEGVV